MNHFDFEVRIAYADTDRMGVVYYANYLVLFERGRVEFMRAAGMRYKEMEDRDGLYLPALEAQLRYLAPARYDDLIRIRTFITEVGGAHLNFRYEVTLPSEDNRLLATGASRHAVVNRSWKPARLTRELLEFFKSHRESPPAGR